jgi:hypothetical protein
MRVSAALLAIGCFLASAGAPAQPPVEGDERLQEAIRQLMQSDPAAQQKWLMHLEQRASRACRLVLKPDEAARQVAKTRARLHQKTVTWQVLGEVIDDADRWEKGAIAEMARRYRLAVFDVFHQQIDVYGRRQQAWLDLQDAWKKAGSRFENQDALLDWLESATRNATSNPPGPIPLMREFPDAAGTQVSTEQPVASPSVPPAAPPVASPPAEPSPRPQVMKRRDSTITRTAGKPVIDNPSLSEATAPGVAPSPPPLPRSAPPRVAIETAPKTNRSVSLPHKLPASIVEAELSQAGIEIRLDELSARIRGCNLGLRGLEATLDEDGDWTAARLLALAERLKIMLLRHHDLTLFWENLSETDRAAVARPESVSGVVSQFAARIVAARNRLSDPMFSGSESQRRTELEQLQSLSRLLAETAAK